MLIGTILLNMNRIVLIGNGFDLAHGLKTSYAEFNKWYKDQRIKEHISSKSRITDDGLSKIIGQTEKFWGHGDSFYLDADFKYENRPFLENINRSIETKGWVDIENEYYRLLTGYALMDYSTEKLIDINEQLHILKEKLIKYLSFIDRQDIVANDKIKEKIYAPIESSDISVEASDIVKNNRKKYGQQNNVFPKTIMLLSFNYTKTAYAYLREDNLNVVLNYIHGTIEKPESIIFGYGDELDGEFEKLKNFNDNECLRNVKSIRYLESDKYRKMLEFIESGPFQVCIMGHSCGNSDRTLLNTLFEHKNCISIKPYYYIKDNGTDNYLEIVQNISRNFTNMKYMRDRVVNKEYCEPLSLALNTDIE